MTDEKKRTERGFRIFGETPDRDGTVWTVVESSLAFRGAHCRVSHNGACMDFPGNGTGWHKHVSAFENHLAPGAHLSVAQAETLAKALLLFVAEARAEELTESEDPR